MADDPKPKDDELTPKQRERLDRLQAEIHLNQVTVSFALEERFIPGHDGRKMSTFYSANAVRKGLGDVGGSWTLQEAQLAASILSKHVVDTVYRDAVRRGILTPSVAKSEVLGIIHRYNLHIRKLLKNEDDKDES